LFMKIFWFVLFMNSAALLFPENITGQWWRYNADSQDHDELLIDENLGFTLRATIDGRPESYEGQIHVIGGRNYHAQVHYNDTIKNGYIYKLDDKLFDDSSSLRLTFYEDETEVLYYGRFKRIKEFPQDKDAEGKETFVFLPMFGTFGGNVNISNTHQNEYLFSVGIFSLNFIYLPAGLELEIIPVKYTYNFLALSEMMSFLNIGLSWNILHFPLKIENDVPEKYLFFGPAFSVNWLNLYDFNYLNINNVIFNAGLKFSIGEPAMFRWLTFETGYRNTGGSHGYYFSMLSDNVIPLFISALPIIWPALFWEWD